MQSRGYREGGVGKRSQLVGNVWDCGDGYEEGGSGRGGGGTQTPIWYGLYNIPNGQNGVV